MTETRVDGGAVRWTDPTGRCWTSPSQHTTPAPAVPAQPRTRPDEPDLSPAALAELVAQPDTDPTQYELRAAAEHLPDRIGDAIRDDDVGWGLALDDPYRWSAWS